ncbi:restriction endonuclease [Pyruvatibacter sp. HU-CL02332]|uniref:restriction endonuclease n=1 Tax=Pyruvatibacter sp. HU-CL02332 TaxID=3127650 RepID=UPI003105407F
MITNDDVPKFSALIAPTVAALKSLGGSASNQEIHDEVVRLERFLEEIVEHPHGDNSTLSELEYRLKWARTYLKKVGAVNNAKPGIWTLTAHGFGMSEDELGEVPRRVRTMNRNARKEAETLNSASGMEDESGDVEPDWQEELLQALLAMDPSAFERLCQRVLRESGFVKVEVTGRSSDGGIDGNGILRVNLVSFQVLFQSKRWQGSVGSSVVRDFRGAMMGRADKGLIITTSRFTAEARAEATRDGAPAIDLIDGEDLCDLLKNLRIGTKVEMVEQVEVDTGYFAEF